MATWAASVLRPETQWLEQTGYEPILTEFVFASSQMWHDPREVPTGSGYRPTEGQLTP